MNERSLVKLSLIASFIGLFLLFVISLFADAEEISISELNGADLEDVKIRGKVIAVEEFENMALVEIAEMRTAKVVVFDKSMLTFGVGDDVTVVGEVKDYRGEKEIVAEKIIR
ncbi:hypothetical protein HYX10_03670 [Candidatus Woesearchaeota archaeon]|nr:hypothetical protein [Candidatus Woesearchaeota archaeon]